MRPDLKLNVKIDVRVESYKSFFDHAWAKSLLNRTDGSKLEEPAFRLHCNWKAAANAQFMPWLMMESIHRFEHSYLRSQPTFSDNVLRAISESFGLFLDGEISNTVNKKLTKKIRKFILDKQGEITTSLETWKPDELRPQRLFDQFVLTKDGGSEIQLAIHGAQRVCYAAIFFEYENYLKTCVRAVTGNDKYRPNWNVMRDDIARTFDPATAKTCCKDDPVEVGRLIRNCIAHQGGELTDHERKHLPTGMFDELDGFVIVMPDHNRTLFNALKERVTLITEATVAKLKTK